MDTPHASLAAAIARSPDGTCETVIAGGLPEHVALAAITQLVGALIDERGARPSLRCAFMPGALAGIPGALAYVVAWAGDAPAPPMVAEAAERHPGSVFMFGGAS